MYKSIDLKNIKKILVINLGGIGDLLLSQPALRALKKNYPSIELVLVVVKRVSFFLKNPAYGFIDKVFLFEPNFLYIFRNLKTLLSLRKEKFDIAINMRTLVSKKGARNIRLFLKFISAGLTVGRNTEGRGLFFDIKIEETDKGLCYERDYDIKTVETLGVFVEDKNIYFEISQQSSQKIDNLLKDFGIEKDKLLIGIHIGGMPSRRWPLKYFGRVLDILSEKLDCSFVITGSRPEKVLAKRLRKFTKVNFLDLVGKLTIDDLASLIKRCNIFISNDTGPMHLAAVLKVPLIAIFGGGDLTRYNPKVIFEDAVVLKEEVDCSPCNKFFCSSKKCLYNLSYQRVVESVFKILKNDK